MESQVQNLTPLSIYVQSRSEADWYREQFRQLGVCASGFVVQIVDDASMRLPAVRTPTNLYEGEPSVSRLMASLAALIPGKR